MKKFLGIILASVMIMGLAVTASAGDVKLGGELDVYGAFGDGVANDPAYSADVKIKITQDLTDTTSWRIRFKYEYDGAINYGDPNKLKLEDAYFTFKIQPAELLVGRFESKWDADHAYFGERFKSPWRERNILGFQLSGKANDNLKWKGALFTTEGGDETHYGLQGKYNMENLDIVGAFYSKKKETSDLLVQSIFSMDQLAFYGLAHLHSNDDSTKEYTEFTLGASAKFNNFIIYLDDQIKDMDEGDSENNLRLGLRYYLAKKSYVYTYADFCEDSKDDTIATGLFVEF